MNANREISPTPPIPQEWQPYYAKLQALRESLLENHLQQIAGIVEALEKKTNHSTDDLSGDAGHHLTLGLLASEQDALLELDSAIQRIFHGTYGICEQTGKPIPDARLRVVPWTRYTREALENIDRERMVNCRTGGNLPPRPKSNIMCHPFND
jgi:RNA polymerase-binding transcription factor DksA